ncbi:TPA: hypothetical protein U5G34_005485 [Klebsiella pneumoniae]|nr:hypothetical protein [Klebsiella pneumoniae]HEN3693761.1 hypothetical protein [Klebsiella pneumoniae]
MIQQNLYHHYFLCYEMTIALIVVKQMKTRDKPKFKILSVEKIESSHEIAQWLMQFNSSQKAIAKNILSKLIFVSRDEFTIWLQKSISDLPKNKNYALYSVRKLDPDKQVLWDLNGDVVNRPGHSQGSEDLVYSIISNLVRSNKTMFLDHPSLNDLKKSKVNDFLLIDDSIGSGDRVSGFINAMLDNPTFLSWWSLGLVRLTLISFARTLGSENRIINTIRGSDHGVRKYRKSEKINFISNIVYNENWLETRWGEQYNEIINLCKNQTKIPSWARLGYGNVLSNIIFYHSVPNNLPGILWFSNKKWQGLMPDRAIPGWLLALLENGTKHNTSPHSSLSPEIINLLKLIKRGVRDNKSIALRLNVDCLYVEKLLIYAETLGLLTTQKRLSKFGLDKLLNSRHVKNDSVWDFGLYIPESWCADQHSVQPLNNDE